MKNSLNVALFALMLAACGGMDTGAPDPNDSANPSDTEMSDPNTDDTNNSNPDPGGEMSFLGDCTLVQWLLEKTLTCDSAGDVRDGRIYSLEKIGDTCVATWTLTGDKLVFLAGMPNDAEKLTDFRQENEFLFPAYAQNPDRLTVFTGDDEEEIPSISCAVAQ